MKRILALTILLTSSLLPFSCNDDDCGDYDRYEVTMEDFALKTAFHNGDRYYESDFSDRPQEFESAAIMLELTKESRVKISQSTAPSKFSWITPLMACSPSPDEVVNRITALTISAADTIYTDSLSYAPNVSLNELFHLPHNRCGSRARCDIDGRIYNVVDRTYSLYARQSDPLIFMLRSAPDSLIDTTFRFEIILNDGKAFDLSIGPVLIE